MFYRVPGGRSELGVLGGQFEPFDPEEDVADYWELSGDPLTARPGRPPLPRTPPANDPSARLVVKLKMVTWLHAINFGGKWLFERWDGAMAANFLEGLGIELAKPRDRGRPAIVTVQGEGHETAERMAIILGGPDDDVIVCGKRKAPLPPAQYRVVKALVDAKVQGERLNGDVLRNRTKDENGRVVEDPVGALKRLCKRDRDWKRIIDMATVPGRGYALKDCPPTPTQKN
jgi:hypothetical protein